MAKKPASNQPQETGEDKRPAGPPVEHPRRLRPGRGPYKNRILTPDRMNGGYDTKD
jgi:hypothetical protein